MSIFGYILLGIWGAMYLALFFRRMHRRQRAVRISGNIPRLDLEAIAVPVECTHHTHHPADVVHHTDVSSHHH